MAMHKKEEKRLKKWQRKIKWVNAMLSSKNKNKMSIYRLDGHIETHLNRIRGNVVQETAWNEKFDRWSGKSLQKFWENNREKINWLKLPLFEGKMGRAYRTVWNYDIEGWSLNDNAWVDLYNFMTILNYEDHRNSQERCYCGCLGEIFSYVLEDRWKAIFDQWKRSTNATQLIFKQAV